MAAGGYPGDYRTGDVIHGLPWKKCLTAKCSTRARNWRMTTGSDQRRARTVRHRAGSYRGEAQKRAYALMTDIHWDDCFCGKISAGALSNASRTNATVLQERFARDP